MVAGGGVSGTERQGSGSGGRERFGHGTQPLREDYSRTDPEPHTKGVKVDECTEQRVLRVVQRVGMRILEDRRIFTAK